MGCLNSTKNFSHWFGNIHLSGPCNRSCYFCIGQHMMALDKFSNLDTWPLLGIEQFIIECIEHNVNEINVTGTNTDPLLYSHTRKLRETLKSALPDLRMGLRTNGVLFDRKPEIVAQYDKGSITICSLNPKIYKQMMGQGHPPDIDRILQASELAGWSDLKVNIVLGPENVEGLVPDLVNTISSLARSGVKRVNLREPYGQSHIGDPLLRSMRPIKQTMGMPTYDIKGCLVTYWDVHYVEVESINLYATGRVSQAYPITLGHDDNGSVSDQRAFSHGRHQKQWQSSSFIRPERLARTSRGD